MDNKKKAMAARKRRAKLQIDVFASQSNTEMLTEPETATTRNDSQLQIKKLVFASPSKQCIGSDSESDSDEEFTDASELVAEHGNLQMYTSCAKK